MVATLQSQASNRPYRPLPGPDMASIRHGRHDPFGRQPSVSTGRCFCRVFFVAFLPVSMNCEVNMEQTWTSKRLWWDLLNQCVGSQYGRRQTKVANHIEVKRCRTCLFSLLPVEWNTNGGPEVALASYRSNVTCLVLVIEIAKCWCPCRYVLANNRCMTRPLQLLKPLLVLKDFCTVLVAYISLYYTTNSYKSS